MNDPIASFFGFAKHVALTKRERQQAAEKLAHHVRSGAEDRHQPTMEPGIDLLRATARLRLTDAERQSGLSALRAHMARHPPRRRLGWDFSAFLQRMVSATAGLAAATATVGGIALAAERSAPGDMLYAMKVAVNERVGMAYLREQPGQEWLLARRMREVEVLDARGEREAASLHLRAQQHLANGIALRRPDAPVLQRQMALAQRVEGTIAVALPATAATDEAITMHALVPAPRDGTSEGSPADSAPETMLFATDMATAPEDAPPAKGLMMQMAAQEEAPPTENTMMMARKALIMPSASGGNTGSGTQSSGNLLPLTPPVDGH